MGAGDGRLAEAGLGGCRLTEYADSSTRIAAGNRYRFGPQTRQPARHLYFTHVHKWLSGSYWWAIRSQLVIEVISTFDNGNELGAKTGGFRRRLLQTVWVCLY